MQKGANTKTKLSAIIKKILHVENVDEIVAGINYKSIKEAENTTALIHEMNRKLVVNSVAFKIYRATGHSKYGDNDFIAN